MRRTENLDQEATSAEKHAIGSARVAVARVFQDGDFVFAHTDYNFFGPKVGFDVFRFEAGRLVEHWDTIETIPARESWKNQNGKF